jgi:hypothetical protein
MNAFISIIRKLSRMAPQHPQTKGTDEFLSGSQSSKLLAATDDASEADLEDPPCNISRDKSSKRRQSQKDKSETARQMMMQLEEANEVDEEENDDDAASEDSDLSNLNDYYESSHPLKGAKKWKWVAEVTLVLLALIITVSTWVVQSRTQENSHVAEVRAD